jgi:hypothetical protein
LRHANALSSPPPVPLYARRKRRARNGDGRFTTIPWPGRWGPRRPGEGRHRPDGSAHSRQGCRRHIKTRFEKRVRTQIYIYIYIYIYTCIYIVCVYIYMLYPLTRRRAAGDTLKINGCIR